MNDYDDAAAAAHYENDENMRPVGPGKRPKRPARTLGKHVPVRFPVALVMEIKRLADQDGMTVSSWIRHVVTREVEWRRLASDGPLIYQSTTAVSGDGVVTIDWL